MAINLSVWEDSGPVSAGHGTIRQEVDNLGFKESGLDESFLFPDNPIGRPLGSEVFTTSFKKYYYFKFDGTYTNIQNIAVKLDGDPAGSGSGSGEASKVRIIYKWTNVYQEPDSDLLDGISYDPSSTPIWRPMVSTVGPEAAITHVDTFTPNQTYYTAYLQVQLYVDKSDNLDYGNLSPIKLQFIINEEKTGLPGFDADAINWSP